MLLIGFVREWCNEFVTENNFSVEIPDAKLRSSKIGWTTRIRK